MTEEPPGAARGEERPFLLSYLLTEAGIPHGFGTRLTPAAAFPPDLFTLAQVHGARVVTLSPPLPPDPFRFTEADALTTARPGIRLGVRTADCLPVLLADPAGGVAGAVHCGWRSLAAGILGKTVKEMVRLGAGDPATFLAALGPCIRACCYEVGAEVREAFAGHPGADAAFSRTGGRLILDLPAAVRAELGGLGLPPESIDTLEGACTRCRPEIYHSWRGEKTKERMVSWIGRRED